MVPRSYAYTGPNAATGVSYNEKQPSVKAVERGGLKPVQKTKGPTNATPMPSGFTPSASAPSKPVVIPTRTRNDARRKSKGEEHDKGGLPRNQSATHDRTLLSPSASVLLAMTSIPDRRREMTSTRRRVNPQERQRTMQQAIRSKGQNKTFSSSSPQAWVSLMSPPDEDELKCGSMDSETTIGRLSPSRSISTESMPSLEEDEESLLSASNPATPGLGGSGRGGRKSLSTSVGEECALDHPLLPPLLQTIDPIHEQTEFESEIGTSRLQPNPIQPRSTFKSNLTASFRAVRSAARSFSNLANPPNSIHRDDLLSESLLSLTLPYAVERRPLPSPDPPDPALRRYLNPIQCSPSELHFHRQLTTTTTPIDSEPAIKASIQMQSYQRGTRLSEHASAPPIFLSQLRQPPESPRQQGLCLGQDALDTEDAFTSSPAPVLARQREPRENGDFLRVIVLEMNMRRCGKLAVRDPGRARLWLPARQVAKSSESLGAAKMTGQGNGLRSDKQDQETAGSNAMDRERNDIESGADRQCTSHTGQTHVTSKRRPVIPTRWTGISA